jgi:hypothetical protein
MTIGNGGKVNSSLISENTTRNVALGQCIAKAAKKWVFPKPPGGGDIVVSYPFNLSPS